MAKAMAKPLDPSRLEAEIARLRTLGISALRAEWQVIFKKPPQPGLSKDLLGRMIAYRLQEQVFGGLDPEMKRFLTTLATSKTPADLPERLKPGTLLVRDYQGERHEVTILRAGYVWRGAVYSSLSAIAKAITGTSWNGRRFFGVDSVQSARQPPVGGTKAQHASGLPMHISAGISHAVQGRENAGEPTRVVLDPVLGAPAEARLLPTHQRRPTQPTDFAP
jgi:hypothetical protein